MSSFQGFTFPSQNQPACFTETAPVMVHENRRARALKRWHNGAILPELDYALQFLLKGHSGPVAL